MMEELILDSPIGTAVNNQIYAVAATGQKIIVVGNFTFITDL
jgi:hypothetical protein